MKLTLLGLSLFLGSVMSSQAAITLASLSTFQNGSLNGWANGGSAADPVNVATGGPAGAGDRFMRVTSDGSGPGGRLTVFNRGDFAGNYIGSGVQAISMDLLNTASLPLTIRFSLRDAPDSSARGYVTTTGFSLPGDGLWHSAVFSLAPANLTPINGPAAPATFLTNVAEARIFHSPVANTTLGVNFAGSFSVDNIRALAAVPEPGSAVLLLLAGAAALRRRR